MKIRAEMGRSCGPILPPQYQVDKVVELSNAQFAAFMIQPLDSYEFIKQNKVEAHQGDGFDHCLLVLGDESTDGVLVQCGSHDRASWIAYIAGARDVVQAQLDRAVDFIVQGTGRTASGSWCVYCEELEEKFGLTVRDSSGFDAMLKETLVRRPEVASVIMANGAIETTFHPEFCAALRGSAEEEKQVIRLRDILPLLQGSGLTFLSHEEADTSVLAENLRTLTATGRDDYAALLNARVSEIVPTAEGTEVVLTDVAPEELARFNEDYEAFQEAEQVMGPMC